ncbi:MAG: hypothetical protein ACE5HW_02650 [Candidatus Methanofastidiosia archaeon]
MGIGVGLLVCALVFSNLISEFDETLKKYNEGIDDFYDFTHSYGFQTIQNLIDQTVEIYKTNSRLREALETFGMGQLGQLLYNVDENFDKIVDFSEDLFNARSSVREAKAWILYLEVGGIVLIVAGLAMGMWAFRQENKLKG